MFSFFNNSVQRQKATYQQSCKKLFVFNNLKNMVFWISISFLNIFSYELWKVSSVRSQSFCEGCVSSSWPGKCSQFGLIN